MKSSSEKNVCPATTDDFSKSFMYSIHELYFLVQKHLEHILTKHKSLSFSQFLILVGFKCSPDRAVSQSLIAERLNLAEATVSRHVSTLVDLQLLSRSQDVGNRRKYTLTLTPKGKKVFDEANTLIDKELNDIFSSVKEKDRAGIMKNFSTILSQLQSKK